MATKPKGESNKKDDSTVRMLINYVPGDECRVAVLRGDVLEEIHAENVDSQTLVGNIYVGKVSNVEASIQAAFVDFGHGVNGFLHISDLHPMYFPGEDKDTVESIGKKTPRRERPAIQDCLKKGQRVLVQVIKEGINTKGPTLTSYLSIPGRYMVMLPYMDRVGVSRKVEDDDIRKEARKILDALDLPENFGFILRTAGMERTKAELKRDLAYLQRLWKDIDRRLKRGGDRPRPLYAESDLMIRMLRDTWTSDVSEIVIDNEHAVTRAARFMKIVSPRTSTKLLQYDEEMPMFWAYGVEPQLQQILAREVPLPSGGSLVIDETEAMIAIDVNSGKMRSAGDAETTAFKTNQEAVPEICRQLKLRDVGGLVVCDLIDMMKKSNRRDIENLFRDCMKNDKAAAKVLPISQFGIVEMTRQRMKGSMRSQHFVQAGEGVRGIVRRPDSVARQALRELAKLLAYDRIHKVEMVVSPRVAGELLSHRRRVLTRLETRTHKIVEVRVSESIPMDRTAFYAYDDRAADVAVERLPVPKPPKDLEEWTIGGGSEFEQEIEAELEAERQAEIEARQKALEAELDAEELSDDDAMQALEDVDSGEFDADEEGGSRKRRRRRGGRRRRKGSEESEATESDAAEGESTPDEGEGSGRRRRRRRRGKGEGEAADQPHRRKRSETPIFEDGKAFIDDWGDNPPPKDRINQPLFKRGDSWDLQPGENGQMPIETVIRTLEAEPQEDTAEARPASRGRVRQGRRKNKKAQGSAQQDASRGDGHQDASSLQAPRRAHDAGSAHAGGDHPQAKKGRASAPRSGTRADGAALASADAGQPTDKANRRRRNRGHHPQAPSPHDRHSADTLVEAPGAAGSRQAQASPARGQAPQLGEPQAPGRKGLIGTIMSIFKR